MDVNRPHLAYIHFWIPLVIIFSSLPQYMMHLRRWRRLFFPVLDNVLSGSSGVCTLRTNRRAFRVAKSTSNTTAPSPAHTRRPGIRQRSLYSLQNRPWLNFALSRKDHHARHDRGCFIDHLGDMMKLFTWMNDASAELRGIAQQYDDLQTEIVRITSRLEVCEQGHNGRIMLGSLESTRDLYKEKIQQFRDLQDEQCIHEAEIRRRIERVRIHTDITRTQVCDTAPAFCRQVAPELGPLPTFMTSNFLLQLGDLKSCAAQTHAARSRLNSSKQDGVDNEGRILLARNLAGLRENLKRREERIYNIDYDDYVGNGADLVYHATEANLQRLQHQLNASPDDRDVRPSDEDDSVSDLTREDDRLPDGRPSPFENAEIENWPSTVHSVNGIAVPRAQLEHEIRMTQLAGTIFEANQDLRIFEKRLRELRDRYLLGMTGNIITNPAMDRASYDILWQSDGRLPIVEQEADLIQHIAEETRDLQEAQRAMRDYIDSRPVPSEDTFREQTNDRNSGDDAAGPQILAARTVRPWPVRAWQAWIAREAAPPWRGTNTAPSWDGSSVGMSSVRFSEDLSNGNGSDYSETFTRRRARLITRNEEVSQQKRQHLESTGIVFRPDDVGS